MSFKQDLQYYFLIIISNKDVILEFMLDYLKKAIKVNNNFYGFK